MPISRKRRFKLIGGAYIKAMAEHEARLAELYECFALAIPSAHKFWKLIAEEEIGHQDVILLLGEKMQKGEIHFQRPNLPSSDFTESVTWIEGIIKRMQQSGISMRNALRIALQVEQRTLEMGYMQIIDEDCPEAQKILTELRADTKKHLQRVEHEARRLKWKILGKHPSDPLSERPKPRPVDVRKQVQEQQADILDGMISLEEALSGLYNTYNNILTDTGGFWAKIAAEEMQHAAMLKTLVTMLERGDIFHHMQQFQRTHIDAVTDYVLDTEFDAKNVSLTHHMAATKALEMEACVYESSFYNQVESTAPEFQHIAKRLQELTALHMKKIEQELEKSVHEERLLAREKERSEGK